MSDIEKVLNVLALSEKYDLDCSLKPADCTRLMNFIDALQTRIAELESKQRWISVKERLPELDEDVFVLLENGIGYGCLYEYKGKINWHLDFDAYGNEVYYWMPLPEPPEVK